MSIDKKQMSHRACFVWRHICAHWLLADLKEKQAVSPISPVSVRYFQDLIAMNFSQKKTLMFLGFF